MGTDVADLLLEGHEPDSRAYVRTSVPPSHAVEPSPNASVAEDRPPSTDSVDDNAAELANRFRHLLLHGRKKVSTVVCNIHKSLFFTFSALAKF